MESGTDRRIEQLQAENTPEPQYSEISVSETTRLLTTQATDASQAIDGAADRPTMSPTSTPSPVAPCKPPVGRERTATPEDPNDLEYEPSPKRNKSTENFPSRVPANGSRDTRGVAVLEGVAVPKVVVAPKTSASKTQQHTATFDRATEVIVIDDLPEGFLAVSSSSRGGDNEPLSEQHGPEPHKRKADRESEEESINVKPSSKRQKTGELTLEMVSEKIDACLSVISNLITHQPNLPEETTEHLHQIIRTIKNPNGSIVENLVKDLDSQRALKAKHRDMVQKLVQFVNLNTGTVFPKESPQQEVSKSWTAFYEHIVLTVGPNNTSPKIDAASAGYVACFAENIAYGRIPGDQLKTYIESLSALLKSPHAQQALFSALFCRWIFAAPEPMLHAMHSDGMIHLYNSILSSASTTAAGIVKVQQYDKVAAKLMFEDPDFQKVEVARRIKEFKNSFQTVKHNLCQKSDIPSSKSPSRFAKEVVEFKQQLLLSPKNYRIHYVRPGTVFNARWMQAYNNTNDPVSDANAAGKKVALCVFPALTCEKGVAVKEDVKIEDVLVKNKRFFPTFKESIEVNQGGGLSKAVVLVSMDEEKKKKG